MFNIESGSNKALKTGNILSPVLSKFFFSPIQHVAILLPYDQIMHQEILNSVG